MNGTEKIIAHIERDAGAKVDEIIKNAEAEAAKILEEGNRCAQESYAARIRAGTKDCEALLDHGKRNAGMEAKKELLAARQDCVSKAFEKAKEYIVSMPGRDYVLFLARLAADASMTGEEELIFSEGDRLRVGKAVTAEANAMLKGGKLTLSDETRELFGGFVLKQGDIEVNCSVESMVDAQRDRMAAEVAKLLFEA